MKKLIASVLFFFVCIHVSDAQYVIHGTVVDDQNRPLPAVTVTVGKNLLTTLTDSAGYYSFSFSSANMQLAFSHVGYETVFLGIKAETVPTVSLMRSDIMLAATVVNSFERNSNIKNVPAAVSVLNRSLLERFGTESFVPAVNTIPGVKMDERSPGSYRLSIRGNLLRSTFGVRNVKVYWNGIPFTDANGNTYINEIAFANIGKIEVLKGPSGSMYGAGTGGVVLLSSDLSRVKERSIELNTTVGSFGLFSATASYKQAIDQMNSVLSYSHQQSDGYRRQASTRKDVLNFSPVYFLNSKHDIAANIFYSDLYYQTPGGLTITEMLNDPKQARPAAGIFKSAEAQKAALYLKTLYAGLANNYRFNSHWSNSTSVYLSHTNLKNPTVRNYERKTEQGAGLRTLTKFKSKIFTATIGAEYQYGFSNTSTFGNNLGNVDTLQYHDEIDSRQLNAFVQADLSLMEDFIINAGISYNNFYYGFIRLSESNANKESSNFTPQFIPRISLLKKIRDLVSVYASVSKGYSPPSIDEVHAGDGNFNKQLNAESGINYEAGVKADFLKGRIFLDAAYYIFRMKNTIVSRRDAAGADYFINAGSTKHKGFEIAASFSPSGTTTDFSGK